MVTLCVLIWYIAGFLVVRYTDNGALAMLAYSHPWLALFVLFLCWTLWPVIILSYIKERMSE